MGCIISGIKNAKEVKVGHLDQKERPCEDAVQGFEDVKPMVFAGIYPVDTEDYEELRASMEKLQLNDASLVFEPKARQRLGLGSVAGYSACSTWRLHRTPEREFNATIITTVPNVGYEAYTKRAKSSKS